MKKLALIWCQSRNGIIGKNGKIPWHFPEDMKHFQTLTKGHAVIMGRKTFESLDKALPYRRNIVVSSRNFHIPGAEVYTSLHEAIKEAYSTDNMPFIIGGAEIYRQTIAIATHLFVSEIDLHLDGDVKAPEIDSNDWVLESENDSNSTFLSFKEYRRS
jgi:dihydrofolate reductase